MRHFRASLASLPLLAQPLHAVPVGTYAPGSRIAQQEEAAAQVGAGGRERRAEGGGRGQEVGVRGEKGGGRGKKGRGGSGRC